ncbi:MAG TPA: zinc metalloprotease HtpX [Acidaminococcaceae bacterium]|nr:zinc metalloprotease HtpX [Acidaminococcaceae bacterium]
MKTAFLMTLLTVLLVLVGDYIGGGQGMVFMLVLSVAMNFFTYWYSDKMVLAQYRARAVDESSAPALYGIVKRLAARAGLPVPKVYIIDDPVPNAFATGRNPEHAAVAVTTGLMNYLSPKEIEGVLGHEMTHVRNHDILIGSVAATMAGLITTITRFAFWFGGGRDSEDRNPVAAILLLVLAPIAAAIIQLAVSRSREYKADEGGGRLCGNPDYLADALEKISGVSTRRSMAQATEATAHMFIACPFSKRDMSTLFSTHPAMSEPIRLLRKQAEEMRSRGEIDSDT